MPFETAHPPRGRRIAVVGGGISGLGAAYALAGDNRVVVFEAAGRLGGHARTVVARGLAVDTGFIVYNERNYPRLTGLFRKLDVPTEASNMSFAASFDGGRMEYALRSLDTLFATRSNLVRPSFVRMTLDILRFNRDAHIALDRPELSLGALLDELKLGDAFRRWYLAPFAGAIWSAPERDVLAFPASTLVRFFANHGLLARTGQPEWRTVTGGSRVYVEKLASAIRRAGGEIRLAAPVEAVEATAGPTVRARGSAPERFDAVILACHSDQALRLLADPGPDRSRILGALRYRPNRAVLHSDARQMPERRRCWSSWNFQGRSDAASAEVGVTYWMNRLQNLPNNQPLFVTLNPSQPIDEAKIHDETTFAHPIFDRAAVEAQSALGGVQGRDGLWFAGAYARYGFHEDGLASGLAAAEALGATPAWA